MPTHKQGADHRGIYHHGSSNLAGGLLYCIPRLCCPVLLGMPLAAACLLTGGMAMQPSAPRKRATPIHVCATQLPACRAHSCLPAVRTSAAALIKETETAVISQDALIAFSRSRTNKAADAAAEEEQHKLDKALAAWASGCPASPAGGADGRPAGRRPRGGAAAHQHAAASGVGARALRAAAKYRHIPVQPGGCGWAGGVGGRLADWRVHG